jgi:hypothetical protein
MRLVSVVLLGVVGAVEIVGTMHSSVRAVDSSLMSIINEIPKCAVSPLL